MATQEENIAAALQIITDLGLPRAQRNEPSALCLLALLNLRPDRNWAKAEAPLIGITPIMDWAREHYGKDYAPNTRETIRRQTMHQFCAAGIAVYNPDQPQRPVNSPKAVYQIEPSALALLRTYGKRKWPKTLTAWLAGRETLVARYARERELNRIPVVIGPDREITLSPGEHSELIRAIIEEFAERFAPGSQLIYAPATSGRFSSAQCSWTPVSKWILTARCRMWSCISPRRTGCFGHGHQHLSTVLMHLMMLAFLIDQIQQRCCRLFQAAVTAAKRKTRFWRQLRTRFDLCLIPDWETLYRSIITPPSLPLGVDTSSAPAVTAGARSAVLEGGDHQQTVSTSSCGGEGLLRLSGRAAAACAPRATTRRVSGNCCVPASPLAPVLQKCCLPDRTATAGALTGQDGHASLCLSYEVAQGTRPKGRALANGLDRGRPSSVRPRYRGRWRRPHQ